MFARCIVLNNCVALLTDGGPEMLINDQALQFMRSVGVKVHKHRATGGYK